MARRITPAFTACPVAPGLSCPPPAWDYASGRCMPSRTWASLRRDDDYTRPVATLALSDAATRAATRPWRCGNASAHARAAYCYAHATATAHLATALFAAGLVAV